MPEPTRVYVDMVGDLFHPGHVALLRAARAFGDELAVGVLSDETVASYKRRPVMTMDERVAVIESCRYVDEVIPNSPNRLTREFLVEHNLALVVHGDDGASDGFADVYGSVLEAGVSAAAAHAVCGQTRASASILAPSRNWQRRRTSLACCGYSGQPAFRRRPVTRVGA